MSILLLQIDNKEKNGKDGKMRGNLRYNVRTLYQEPLELDKAGKLLSLPRFCSRLDRCSYGTAQLEATRPQGKAFAKVCIRR